MSEYTLPSPQDIVIQQDDEIRLKIVGTRVDKNDIVSLSLAFLPHFPCCPEAQSSCCWGGKEGSLS